MSDIPEPFATLRAEKVRAALAPFREAQKREPDGMPRESAEPAIEAVMALQRAEHLTTIEKAYASRDAARATVREDGLRVFPFGRYSNDGWRKTHARRGYEILSLATRSLATGRINVVAQYSFHTEITVASHDYASPSVIRLAATNIAFGRFAGSPFLPDAWLDTVIASPEALPVPCAAYVTALAAQFPSGSRQVKVKDYLSNRAGIWAANELLGGEPRIETGAGWMP